jgi:hypothetical protein
VEDHLTTEMNTPLSIEAANLLANDTDPDQDEISLQSVNSSSTRGGTVTLDGTTVVYRPPFHFIGEDTFNYTISDGSLQGTGTVVVNVTAPGVYRTYIPLLSRPGQADLVGSFSISPDKQKFTAGEPVVITAVITNQGTSAATPFWVDLFINPSEPPSSSNVTWDQLCVQDDPCYGIVWPVTEPLLPGEHVTLTSTPNNYAILYPHHFFSGVDAKYGTSG